MTSDLSSIPKKNKLIESIDKNISSLPEPKEVPELFFDLLLKNAENKTRMLLDIHNLINHYKDIRNTKLDGNQKYVILEHCISNFEITWRDTIQGIDDFERFKKSFLENFKYNFIKPTEGAKLVEHPRHETVEADSEIYEGTVIQVFKNNPQQNMDFPNKPPKNNSDKEAVKQNAEEKRLVVKESTPVKEAQKVEVPKPSGATPNTDPAHAPEHNATEPAPSGARVVFSNKADINNATAVKIVENTAVEKIKKLIQSYITGEKIGAFFERDLQDLLDESTEIINSEESPQKKKKMLNDLIDAFKKDINDGIKDGTAIFKATEETEKADIKKNLSKLQYEFKEIIKKQYAQKSLTGCFAITAGIIVAAIGSALLVGTFMLGSRSPEKISPELQNHLEKISNPTKKPNSLQNTTLTVNSSNTNHVLSPER